MSIEQSIGRPQSNLYIRKSLEGLAASVDDYLRKDTTLVARTIAFLSPHTGVAYMRGNAKRSLDMSIAAPSSIVGVAIVSMAVTGKFLEDGKNPFFMSERMGKDGDTFLMYKIRTMRSKAPVFENGVPIGEGRYESEDPRVTPLGLILRRYKIDEIPQVIQVLFRKLSLVGIRPLDIDKLNFLKSRWSQERFESWEAVYKRSSLGLTGVNQIFGSRKKEDLKRYHMDCFYARHASLGFDLYLLWRTFLRITMDNHH